MKYMGPIPDPCYGVRVVKTSVHCKTLTWSEFQVTQWSAEDPAKKNPWKTFVEACLSAAGIPGIMKSHQRNGFPTFFIKFTKKLALRHPTLHDQSCVTRAIMRNCFLCLVRNFAGRHDDSAHWHISIETMCAGDLLFDHNRSSHAVPTSVCC